MDNRKSVKVTILETLSSKSWDAIYLDGELWVWECLYYNVFVDLMNEFNITEAEYIKLNDAGIDWLKYRMHHDGFPEKLSEIPTECIWEKEK